MTPITHLQSLVRAAALAMVLAFTGAAVAQDQPTLDDLLNITPDQPTDQTPPTDTGTAPLDPNLPELIEQGMGDNLTEALREMEQAATRLVDASDPGLDTQRLQESVLRRLDMVIAQAKQQQQQSSSSSSSSSSGDSQQQGQGQPQDTGSGQNAGQNQSGNPQNAGQQNQQQQGDPGQSQDSDPNRAGQADPIINPGDPLAESRKEWGNLPPRVRDELLQGLSERFSPVYREMTEAYYRRLAEEAGSR